MHSEVPKARCTACSVVAPARAISPWWTAARLRPTGTMREIPRGLDAIVAALAKDDIFVAVGTSGAIYPTAVYVGLAGDFGHRTVETCGIE